MCILIVMRGLDPNYPILVAGNRDELRSRASAPPGLWVGQRHRVLSPRDRVAGGTWMAVGDQPMFAGLTNISRSPQLPEALSRGEFPHLALDEGDVEAAVAAVRSRVEGGEFNGFQLVVSDGVRTVVLEHERGVVRVREAGAVAVVTNEHFLGELDLDLSAAIAPGVPLDERLELLREVLSDRGERSGHAILKDGELYGTVSSSLIAIPSGDPRGLVWRYAPGLPDQGNYRSYGNLGRRLLRE